MHISGYDRLRKTQLQANTVKIFPALLGADQGALFAEVGMQWNDVPSNGLRYSRAFIFGLGSDVTVPVPGGSLASRARHSRIRSRMDARTMVTSTTLPGVIVFAPSWTIPD